MPWNYGILKTQYDYRVIEVYPDLNAYCEATPDGETLEELEDDLKAMLEAVKNKWVYEVKDGNLVQTNKKVITNE